VYFIPVNLRSAGRYRPALPPHATGGATSQPLSCSASLLEHSGLLLRRNTPLAPTSVEFFSKEWKRLGDKQSLCQKIHEITRIPELALQGASLSQFSVNERLSWKDGRHTNLEEDKAYSLLGIFGVYIPPIYGEGTGGAFKRLMDEITRLEKCVQDLHLTDPRDDKKRIEDTKGGLLKDSYRWILENSDFQR
jgi:hypothetical protein